MNLYGLAISKSRNGLGIFTLSAYDSGDKLFELEGRLIDDAKMVGIPKKIRDNTFRISEKYYLSPKGFLGDFLNHSCNPNVKLVVRKNRRYIVAITRIGKNRELLLDYSTILANDDGWDMKCNCGYRFCRGLIDMYQYLPSLVLKRYTEKKIIPKYILDIK